MMSVITKDISIDNYTYTLPFSRIAKYPLKNRERSKLLIYTNKSIQCSYFKNITAFISPHSLLVLNNTKVIHARLYFRKKTGAQIEIFCLEPYWPVDYEQIFSTTNSCTWKCMVGNAKKWKDKILETRFFVDRQQITLRAKQIAKVNNTFIIAFSWNAKVHFGKLLSAYGEMPIPPYLNRDSEEVDIHKYQTVYSKNEGSVAAPTSGLHFTKQLLTDLKRQHIKAAELTLHVGAGTFQPVVTRSVIQHKMHKEHFSFTGDFLVSVYDNLDAVVAVGTTSVRSLESIYHIGRKIIRHDENPFEISQWEAYGSNHVPAKKAIQALLNYMLDNKMDTCKASTQMMIVPGYDFQIIKGMLTNFHLPKSTLLLLIAAWVGDDWQKIYQSALEKDFRFLSYGDSSLLFR